MAFTTKEEFEAIVKEQYDTLSKQEFGELCNTAKAKLVDLMKSGDIKVEKTDDDYELTYASENLYEIAFCTLQFVQRTRKLSFKQYKCLSAFIKAKVKTNEETEFKQF
jgi:hypothetical protein